MAIENKNKAKARTVKPIEIITIHFSFNLLVNCTLNKDDIIVIADMVIETYPSKEEFTLKVFCITGHPT